MAEVKKDWLEEALTADDSLTVDEFIHEMAHRGVIATRSSWWSKAKRIVTAPLRLLSAFVGWVTWRLWGRVQYEMAVRKGLERWRQLAGIGASYPSFIDQDYVHRLADSKPADFAVAQAIHDDVIKNKIVKVPLPLPDAEPLDYDHGYFPAGPSTVPPKG